MTRKKLIAFALEFFKAGLDASEVGMPNFDQLIKTEYYKGKIDEILALPIDVPGDDEIEKKANGIANPKSQREFERGEWLGVKEGARWMRDEIIKRNRP